MAPEVGPWGITLDPQTSESLDVLFDGVRLCSLSPQRAAIDMSGRRQLPWPRPLARRLYGRSTVTLREHATGRVLAEVEVRFDESAQRMRLVDSQGHQLALSKWGTLDRSFEAGSQAEAADLVAFTGRLLDDINSLVGIPAYAACGTLLGAVRTGHVIGHDFDTDVAILHRHSHPADLARESFAVQRGLTDAGWQVDRIRGGLLQVWQRETGPERSVDILSSYFDLAGRFNTDQFIATLDVVLDDLLPLGEIEIEGQRLPAPARPEAVLAGIYGPGWRVPDPAFRYVASRRHERRIDGTLGAYKHKVGRWNAFHRLAEEEASAEPSDFVRWVEPSLHTGMTVVDIGCGRGADTVAMARRTGSAVGFDHSPVAIGLARAAAGQPGLKADFRLLRLRDLRRSLAQAAQVSARSDDVAVYLRLVLDALAPLARQNLWRMTQLLLARGGWLFIEARRRPGQVLDPPAGQAWEQVTSPAEVAGAITRLGGRLVAQEAVEGTRRSNGTQRPGTRRWAAVVPAPGGPAAVPADCGHERL